MYKRLFIEHKSVEKRFTNEVVLKLRNERNRIDVDNIYFETGTEVTTGCIICMFVFSLSVLYACLLMVLFNFSFYVLKHQTEQKD